jgi:uncharacterized protein (TIGR03435 family)
MNVLQSLSAEPWVERLGSTLLHFVWQGALIAALYATARRMARAAKPGVRCLIACVALALMAASPLATWVLLRPPVSESVAASFTAPPASTALPTIRTVPTAIATEPPRPSSTPLLSWVVALWFVGAACFALRMAGGWTMAIRLRRRSVRSAPPEWQRSFESLATRIRVSRPVRLLVSSLVDVPAVVGWLRPIVLVPVGALAGLPAEQMEALLLHELAHIRRHDYLVNLVQGVVETLLFYHPAVWWISGHIRAERELCCDDLAVSVTGDAPAYARALAECAAAVPRRLTPVVAANGSALGRRIARLLGEPQPAPGAVSGSGVLAAAILLGVTAFAVFGQQESRPQFEAASIKPSSTRDSQMVRPLPGRLVANAGLRLLIQNAYSLQPFQIVGEPNWDERFEIDAKAADRSDRAQIFLMLQSLLEDRFHLRVHRETRELPVYALVAAKNGSKLPRPKDGACENPPADAPNEWAGGRMQPPGQAPASLPRCGQVRATIDVPGIVLQGGKASMAEFVRMLSLVMGRTVVDKTGVTDLFDVRLAFLPDGSTPAVPPPPPGALASLDSQYPSIFTALQEQLGLRLESTKGPVDVLVIDHVERPSAN